MKAIIKRENPNETEYDIDWRMIENKYKEVEELGVGVPFQDFANLIETKMCGRETVADIQWPTYTVIIKK